MKSKSIRQFVGLLALVILASSLSSCNRGYGCPSNFSVNKMAATVVKGVVKAVK